MTWGTIGTAGRALHKGVVGLFVMVFVLVSAAIVVAQLVESMDAQKRLACANRLHEIGIAVVQYRVDYNDQFPSAVDEKNAAKEPAQYRFAKLLKFQYITAPKVFQCPAVGPDVAVNLGGKSLKEMSEADIAKECLGDNVSSYGIDPRLKSTGEPGRVIVADRPHHDFWGTGVSSPEAGQPGSNSENHKGQGQNVLYNDWHIKWSRDCRDDHGTDPNIYAFNKEIRPEDDSNVDFGAMPKKKDK